MVNMVLINQILVITINIIKCLYVDIFVQILHYVYVMFKCIKFSNPIMLPNIYNCKAIT